MLEKTRASRKGTTSSTEQRNHGYLSALKWCVWRLTPYGRKLRGCLKYAAKGRVSSYQTPFPCLHLHAANFYHTFHLPFPVTCVRYMHWRWFAFSTTWDTKQVSLLRIVPCCTRKAFALWDACDKSEVESLDLSWCRGKMFWINVLHSISRRIEENM